MSVFSLTTTKQVIFQGEPEGPNCLVYGVSPASGGDMVDVWINNETTYSTVPAGTTIAFKRLVNGGIFLVQCAAHSSSTTMADQVIIK